MILALFVALIAYIIAQIIVSFKSSKDDPLVPPSGNIMIVDTETNGFPKDWKGSLYDTDNWARVVSIAWNKIAPNGQLLTTKYYVISPDNYSIQSEATSIHGISTETAQKEGVAIKQAIEDFNSDIEDCKYLAAHNIEFDFPTVFAEYLRLNLNTDRLNSLRQICTMKVSTDYCKIPSAKGYKYPKLNELHQKLFSASITQAHNAKVDAEITMKCLKELYNKKVLRF